ncbi:PLP-dependent aminotransferase family protein [Paenibacillus sp. PDC88]|uniref:MocR-like pyridoxine biosynthesis transcription factor PdxR n=1 Tax=Paenibacillus sp. PDC88 TaxID=1884375 RepID=UPI000897092F|nr:PLP-dependent aminotransferase family protein [Paenibacillus sp. PDC88]SDX50914.1 GntR family transcriptional regulator / MocR family aminotransferase [Paenibacillus sp. PDC88]
MEFMVSWDRYIKEYRYKYHALYHAIRDAILSGTLQSGTQLPATRLLAVQYGLSRGSVATAYDMLQADGYIHTETGRGTYVAFAGIPGEPPEALHNTNIRLSAWGKRAAKQYQSLTAINSHLLLPDEQPPHKQTEEIRFDRSHQPDTDFPYAEWKSLLSRSNQQGKYESLYDPAGDIRLREAIAAHLGATRGIMVSGKEIVLFSGSMQAIALLTQVILDEGEKAVVESPGFKGFAQAVQVCGGEVIPSTVDHHGIIPEDWDARLLFVTPSRQFPTGVVLNLERRLALLAWARNRQAIIIEDSYDSEFRFQGRPIEPLKVLDQEQRVVHIGSFSKTMPEGFRLGYAVLPPALVAPVVAAKAYYDPISAGLYEQRALAVWMSRGGYAKHIRKLTRRYGAKHQKFAHWIQQHAGHMFTVFIGDAGLGFYALWNGNDENYAAFKRACIRRGVYFTDGIRFQLNPSRPSLFFKYAHLSEEQIKEGILRMTLAFEDIKYGQEKGK